MVTGCAKPFPSTGTYQELCWTLGNGNPKLQPSSPSTRLQHRVGSVMTEFRGYQAEEDRKGSNRGFNQADWGRRNSREASGKDGFSAEFWKTSRRKTDRGKGGMKRWLPRKKGTDKRAWPAGGPRLQHDSMEFWTDKMGTIRRMGSWDWLQT